MPVTCGLALLGSVSCALWNGSKAKDARLMDSLSDACRLSSILSRVFIQTNQETIFHGRATSLAVKLLGLSTRPYLHICLLGSLCPYLFRELWGVFMGDHGVMKVGC